MYSISQNRKTFIGTLESVLLTVGSASIRSTIPACGGNGGGIFKSPLSEGLWV